MLSILEKQLKFSHISEFSFLKAKKLVPYCTYHQKNWALIFSHHFPLKSHYHRRSHDRLSVNQLLDLCSVTTHNSSALTWEKPSHKTHAKKLETEDCNSIVEHNTGIHMLNWCASWCSPRALVPRVSIFVVTARPMRYCPTWQLQTSTDSPSLVFKVINNWCRMRERRRGKKNIRAATARTQGHNFNHSNSH